MGNRGKPSLFRTALTRLSFRTKKKTKYTTDDASERVEKIQVNTKKLVTDENCETNYTCRTLDTNQVNEIKDIIQNSGLSNQYGEEQTAADSHKSPSMTITCPPTPSSSWRQKSTPTSSFHETEWKRLRESVRSVQCSRMDITHEVGDKINKSFKHSSLSLNTNQERSSSVEIDGNKGDTNNVVAKAQSIHCLNIAEAESAVNKQTVKLSSPLCQMTPHQKRVQSSLEQLTLPDWYSKSEPRRGSWRQAGPKGDGWRRNTDITTTPRSGKETPNYSKTAPSTPSMQRLSHRLSSRCSPSISSVSTLCSPHSSTVYLGWRSQSKEQLSTLPSSPAVRLMTSMIPHDPSEDYHKEIANITGAIQEFCQETSRQEVDTDSDSGIDRSDDVTPDI